MRFIFAWELSMIPSLRVMQRVSHLPKRGRKFHLDRMKRAITGLERWHGSGPGKISAAIDAV